MARKVKEVYPEDEIIDDLKEFERLLKVLRSEWNMFHMGAMKSPPIFTEAAIRRLMKKYKAGEDLKRAVYRFKFYNMQAKFNTFLELQSRKLKEKEGQNLFGRQITRAERMRLEAEAKEKGEDVEKLIKQNTFKYSAVTRNPAKEKFTVEGLYKAYMEANRLVGTEPKNLSFDKFRSFIDQQSVKLKSQKSAAVVKFSLKIKDGKVKLTGKAVKGKK